jgi:hypothetical protein
LVGLGPFHVTGGGPRYVRLVEANADVKLLVRKGYAPFGAASCARCDLSEVGDAGEFCYVAVQGGARASTFAVEVVYDTRDASAAALTAVRALKDQTNAQNVNLLNPTQDVEYLHALRERVARAIDADRFLSHERCEP